MPSGIAGRLLLGGKQILRMTEDARPTVRLMKMVAEYLDHALQFEKMAAEETNSELRASFEKQAAAYRKLAGNRAKQLGLDMPPKALPRSG